MCHLLSLRITKPYLRLVVFCQFWHTPDLTVTLRTQCILSQNRAEIGKEQDVCCLKIGEEKEIVPARYAF